MVVGIGTPSCIRLDFRARAGHLHHIMTNQLDPNPTSGLNLIMALLIWLAAAALVGYCLVKIWRFIWRMFDRERQRQRAVYGKKHELPES